MTFGFSAFSLAKVLVDSLPGFDQTLLRVVSLQSSRDRAGVSDNPSTLRCTFLVEVLSSFARLSRWIAGGPAQFWTVRPPWRRLQGVTVFSRCASLGYCSTHFILEDYHG